MKPAEPARPNDATARTAARPFKGKAYVNGEPPREPVIVAISTATNADVLDYTHTFVEAYARGRFLPSVAESVGVAAHELLENALNYGSVSADVLLELLESPDSVAVRVSNDAIPARIEMLSSHVQRLLANPEATYLEEMKRSVGGGVTRPMLGLARVVHEARLSLEMYLVKQRISLVARVHTSRRPGTANGP